MSEFDFGDPSFGNFTEADTTVTTEQLEKQYKMYQKFYDFDTFASSKLGWINCDRVLNVEKEVTLQLSLKNHKNITHFSVYYIYKNYKTFLKESYRSTPALSKNFKVSGLTKVVVMSTTNDTYLYDFFYVNKNSKTKIVASNISNLYIQDYQLTVVQFDKLLYNPSTSKKDFLHQL